MEQDIKLKTIEIVLERLPYCEGNINNLPKNKPEGESINQEKLIVNTPISTPKDMKKNKVALSALKHVSNDPRTPKASIELSQELKKVINERNMLTSKTRKRVFEALDEIKSKSEEETRTFKREKALLEIVNSEIKYVRQLETIINFFMKPVQEKRLLKTDDFEILFGNITTIYRINKELLEELDKGYHNVANAFSKIAPFLKLYSVFAYDFRNNLRILQNARTLNPLFAKFVENQESRPEVQSKLSALLITPIQRVPRYKLLLTQLYELTSPKEKDYKHLRECLLKIEDAALHINNIVEEQENAQRLLELQRCLRSGEPNIIMPGRKLKREGILNKMSTKNGHSEKLYVVLMNDIIMFNKMKKEEPVLNSLKVSCIFPLNKSKVIEVLDKGCLKVISQDEELILYHDQLCETIKWIESINLAIQNYLEDRKTLRKESSNRRPVKRKDVNEYHEIGLSPGQPLKKRKFMNPQHTPDLSRLSRRLTARRSIRSACNSTPIRLESNPETSHLSSTSGFPPLETSNFACGSTLKIDRIDPVPDVAEIKRRDDETGLDARSDVFVFGKKHEEQNTTRFGSFFNGIKSTFKGMFGFGGSK
ncbi:hypothetical protein GWI33_017252 [Rhynchophorus ferrugineus]|uniref:Rho guanine nucleotide exchange factor n=1 Tax=Rhynchophorus ferrugineus TaxID=354439 RepID=A0A834HYI1_RHYFE|nr:hypothetical protein GWI33_017252 [Rhynchophorus ferrugineus]